MLVTDDFKITFPPAAAAAAAAAVSAAAYAFVYALVYPFSNMFALSHAIESHGSPMRRPPSATPPLASSPAATSAPPPPPSSAAIISNLFVDCPHALASSTFQFCFVRPSTADDCAQHYGAAPVVTTAMRINASAQELSSLQMMGPPVAPTP